MAKPAHISPDEWTARCDLAALYRGHFTLEQAALGGLRAVLEVPGDAPVGATAH